MNNLWKILKGMNSSRSWAVLMIFFVLALAVVLPLHAYAFQQGGGVSDSLKLELTSPAPTNTAPVVSDVAASQVNGTVEISYQVTDAEQSTVTISFQYWNGSAWVECATTTGEGGTSIGTGKAGTWDAKADFGGQYMTDAKIKVIADDGQAANNVGTGESAAFTLDTRVAEEAALPSGFPFWILAAIGGGGALIVGIIAWRLVHRSRAKTS